MQVLGIDAGGTKTVCLLADEGGTILSEARGPGVNLQASGELEVEEVLRDVMIAAMRDRPVHDATTVCVGIAGADRKNDAQAVEAIVQRIAPGLRVLVVSDAWIALTAGVGEGQGIVVIAGTGSIAYGRSGAGVVARSGGWGHLIGDEGSGYWIGRKALAAVVRDVDGRGPETRLTVEVLAHFGVPNATGLVRVVYDRETPRKQVAALGPVVQRSRDLGDGVAAQILEAAADELALAAGSVASRLAMRGEMFPFVMAGSVFRLVPAVTAGLERRLVEIAPRSHSRLLDVEPARGAISLALADAKAVRPSPRAGPGRPP
jgi:N-acetylglucosamine kinase-like BadF-type ATPase